MSTGIPGLIFPQQERTMTEREVLIGLIRRLLPAAHRGCELHEEEQAVADAYDLLAQVDRDSVSIKPI